VAPRLKARKHVAAMQRVGGSDDKCIGSGMAQQGFKGIKDRNFRGPLLATRRGALHCADDVVPQGRQLFAMLSADASQSYYTDGQ
jgi:hypothetical protein